LGFLITGLLALVGSLGGAWLVLRAEANKLIMTYLIEKRIESIWDLIKQSNKTYEAVAMLLAAVSNNCSIRDYQDRFADLLQASFVLALYIDEGFDFIESYVQLTGKMCTKPMEFHNNDLPKLKILR
jgi:hypothetical protein